MNIVKLAYVLAILVIVTTLVSSQNNKVEVFYDPRGFPMMYVPEGTLYIGITLEDAVTICERLVVAEGYPPCRTMDGLGMIEKSRQDPFEISVGTFYIDQYEISRLDYELCVNADVCSQEPFLHQPSTPSDVPIQYISYYDAAVYCAWREARLPTETEWEYAARGPFNSTFPWGNEFDGSLVNSCDKNCLVLGDAASQSIWNDGYSEVAPVTVFSSGRSWIGAYNMAGNVLEWTSTRSALNQSPTDDLRVIKGGSYDSYPYQTAGWFKSAFISNQGRANIGFRCVRTSVMGDP
jgi:formylglycine-generating enzyme required for sulfatase activity